MTRHEYEAALAILTAEAAAGRGDLRQRDYPDAGGMLMPFRGATLSRHAPVAALAEPVAAFAALLMRTGGMMSAIVYPTASAGIELSISRDLDPDEIAAAKQAAQPATTGGAV